MSGAPVGNNEIILQADAEASSSLTLADLQCQITPEWLSTALAKRVPGLVVESVHIDRVIAGCSVKLWVTMEYNEAGRRANLPDVMVVKAGFARHSPVMLFTYESEMTAYRDVLSRFPIHSPQCFYAGKSPDGVSAAIIIEDLTARNARFCHATQPLDHRDAQAMLTALARFHAQTWNHPALTDDSFEWAQRYELAKQGLAAYQQEISSPAAWAKYMSLPRSWAVPKRFHDRERFLQAMTRLQARGAQQAQVILMGDAHLGNLYFEQDGTPGFLDFQSRIAPWSQEVAYFLGAALDIEDRRRWEKQLLAHYLAELERNDIDAPSFAAGWRTYCEQLLFALFVWLTNGEEFQTEVVNTANAARLGHAALDTGTLDLLSLQD
ncbi:MAG: hypothetical protein ABW110_11430 [Steroidobacteraceae bacterium]